MKSIKIMIFGLAIILISLFIQGEPGIKFYGNEIFIGGLGFILICIGFFMKDRD
ncbi:hypothetical protein [Paenibacillus sp. SN-8-1]|uniref:hypothetical protein n=1 Tax=Paenibacillus sp. SN-8-1 TaxID=3435409 RepID=UPI003D9A70BD